MNNSVITISRQYGSGGHEIGLKLFQALHVPCHDKDIVESITHEKGYVIFLYPLRYLKIGFTRLIFLSFCFVSFYLESY